MEHDALPVNSHTEKLRFIRSPIHHNYDGNTPEGSDASRSSTNSNAVMAAGGVTRPQNSRALERIGYKYRPEDTPWLRRNDDATNLEVFYDLFFACLNLFNRNQKMDTLSGLGSYAGFFSLMWTTWFITGAYDVRFLTDSIFERCCRGAHLAVLIGFVVVSPNFDIAGQNWTVFRSFAFTLMVSRLTLGLEYAVLFFQAWHYKSKWQVAGMAALNFLYGILYVTISTRFGDDNSRLFVSLYIICAVEIIAVVMTAVTYPILSFQGTPIIRRISLLTLIIFGEGITIACTNVTDIIVADGLAAWTPQLWGTVAACCIIIYLAFMLYFDSLHNFYLSTWRTHLWTILHFPLHLSLTLFVEGCSQFIVFWKSIEMEIKTAYEWSDLFLESIHPDNDDFSRSYRRWLDEFFDAQPPIYYTYRLSMDDALDDLRNFNGSDKAELADTFARANLTLLEDLLERNPAVNSVLESMSGMMYACLNILFAQYGLDYSTEAMSGQNITEVDTGTVDVLSSFDLSLGTTERVGWRIRVAVQYTLVCGGGFLALLMFIYCLGRTDRWTRWPVLRIIFTLLLALGTGLLAFISQNKMLFARYISTPWILPPLTILFFVVLVLHHLPEEPLSKVLLRVRPYRWVRGKMAARRQKARRENSHEKRRGSNSEIDHLRREGSDRASLEHGIGADLEQGQRGVGERRRGSTLPLDTA